MKILSEKQKIVANFSVLKIRTRNPCNPFSPGHPGLPGGPGSPFSPGKPLFPFNPSVIF